MNNNNHEYGQGKSYKDYQTSAKFIFYCSFI